MVHSLTAQLHSYISDGSMLLADGAGGAKGFFDSPIGQAVSAICGAIAAVIIVVGIIKMISGVLKGDLGKGLKTLFGCVIVGALLFNPGMTITLVETLGDLIGKLFESLKKIAST